ncbi:MAG TPA: HAMP domain-containing sensor histidine kinase [Ktedonobacterales bacterium]|nr:HAMP domain-containing sensor histidine kinase [Ktedonobacterales bacterium]
MQRSSQVLSASSDGAGSSLSVARLAGFRSARFWLIVGILFSLVLLVGLLLAITDVNTRAAVSGVAQTIVVLLALGCSAWVSTRVPPGRARWAWRLIAVAQGLYLLANALTILFPPAPNSPQVDYLTVILFLSFYAFLALGMLILPVAETTTARQIRLLLDVFIVVGALLGPSVVFLIVPRFLNATPLDYVYIAYPFADLTLLLVAAIQVVRGIQQVYRPAFFWLMAGSFCFVYADTAFNVITLPQFAAGAGASFGVPWIDPFWVAGLCAFVLAALSLVVTAGERGTWQWLETLAARLARIQPSQISSQFFLLALPVLILFGLILFSLLQSASTQQAIVPLLIVTLVVVLLIIIRQLLTMRDLVDARIATQRAEQLDALKDQFITSVNHELRTPLMTMTGYIDLLADPEMNTSPEKRVDMLERARNAGANLSYLVRSILDTRRIEDDARNFTPDVVNLREATEAALSLIDTREADPAGRRLHLQIPENLTIWGDQVRIQQILTNLLSNAIKYSPAEAPIWVTAYLVGDKNTRVLGRTPTNRAAKPMVEITVQDQGLGIPPEQKELLFRRFVRLPREIAGSIHGTGLGLYLCRVFTEAMGGSIWVESTGEPGEGSTFHLRLLAPVEGSPSLTPTPSLSDSSLHR